MLYQINNLVCGYKERDNVLSIPELEIAAGKIVVVLGKSGSGKSTFLETLALMNNTLKEGSVRFTPPSLDQGSAIDLGQLWKEQDADKLSQIRCRHFSFIFQHTNLMPNFSVFENIFIPCLMQGNTLADCKIRTKKILDRIGLSVVDTTRKVTELSGGQKQRVAFARAIISSFDVLFGDEPTGNLDEVNSVDLLTLLKESILENNQQYHKTAIIVSHSLSLALKFADSILLITSNEKKNGGDLFIGNCFHKIHKGAAIQWHNHTAQYSENEFEDHLRSLFRD